VVKRDVKRAEPPVVPVEPPEPNIDLPVTRDTIHRVMLGALGLVILLVAIGCVIILLVM